MTSDCKVCVHDVPSCDVVVGVAVGCSGVAVAVAAAGTGVAVAVAAGGSGVAV